MITNEAKNEPLVQKMWRAENIKNNLVKLVKISKNSTNISPNQLSLNTSNGDLSAMSRAISPNTSFQNSGVLTNRCRNCEKMTVLLRQTKIEKKDIQNKCNNLVENLSQINKQKESLYKKLSFMETNYCKASEAIQPYQNNVNLMQQQLNFIKQYLSSPSSSNLFSSLQKQLDEKKNSLDMEVDYLKKSHQKDQVHNETKISALNSTILLLENKIKELDIQNQELARSNKILNGIVSQSGYVVQQRELIAMAGEENYQLHLDKQMNKKEKQNLNRLILKLKNKISMLTSLIGYGVVSNIENNDLHEIALFRENLQNNFKIQQKFTNDIFGMQALKSHKESHSEIQGLLNIEEASQCLYQPNFLIMFEDQEIKNALEENVTTIIKPEFFLLIRAVLDSKYHEFLVEKDKALRFTDFTFSFIDFFRLKKKEKRIELYSKKNNEENDFMKTNFFLRIFDRKLGYLPQIATFKQFILKNIPQDEVFYFLMCRNFLLDGPQLDNYISCSDSYNYVQYTRTIKVCQELLQNLDNRTKSMVFSHLNNKKEMKNKIVLIKSNYVLRLLLEVYRKVKKDKIAKLKVIFDQVCRYSKTNFAKFPQFKQILKKNFAFLANSQIYEYYRKTLAIFHSNQKQTFFEAFCSTCVEYIFLWENLAANEKIKKKLEEIKQIECCNYLLELIPDSVINLGNEKIYNEYNNFVRMKSIGFDGKIKMAHFLLKVLQMRLWSVSISERRQHKLSDFIDELNNRVIDFLNLNFRKRQNYEKDLDKASSLIGKQCRKKIYQFYSQFVKDIKKQIDGNHKNVVNDV